MSDPENRSVSGKFKVGYSGNPGGRPKKLEELSEPIGKWTPEFLQRLYDIAMNGEHKDSTAAIKLMWGYRYGNPAQVVTDGDGNPAQIGILIMPAEDAGG